MRVWSSFVVLLFALLPGVAWAQPAPSDQPAPQIKMDFAVGKRMAEDLDKKRRPDRRSGDHYVSCRAFRTVSRPQRTPRRWKSGLPLGRSSTRLFCRIGCCTSAPGWRRARQRRRNRGFAGARIGPCRSRLATRASRQVRVWNPCVLGRYAMPGGFREHEQEATRAAIAYLKAAQYDPAAVLDLLSKISYEHPLLGSVYSGGRFARPSRAGRSRGAARCRLSPG